MYILHNIQPNLKMYYTIYLYFFYDVEVKIPWDTEQNLSPWSQPLNMSKKFEVTLNRFLFGHSQISQNFLMNKEDPPICPPCRVHLSIKHIQRNAIHILHIKNLEEKHIFQYFFINPNCLYYRGLFVFKKQFKYVI